MKKISVFLLLLSCLALTGCSFVLNTVIKEVELETNGFDNPKPVLKITKNKKNNEIEINITWDTIKGVSNYCVYYANVDDFSFAKKLEKSEINDMKAQNCSYSHVNNEFKDGTTYYYWIISKTSSGIQGRMQESEKIIYSKTGNPYTNEAPSDVKMEGVSDSTYYHISWTAVDGVESYNVYRNTTNDFSTATKIVNETKNYFYNTSGSGTSNTVAYYYWVTSNRNGVESDKPSNLVMNFGNKWQISNLNKELPLNIGYQYCYALSAGPGTTYQHFICEQGKTYKIYWADSTDSDGSNTVYKKHNHVETLVVSAFLSGDENNITGYGTLNRTAGYKDPIIIKPPRTGYITIKYDYTHGNSNYYWGIKIQEID